MKTIWKYPIPVISNVIEIELPNVSHIVHVDVQAGLPHIWVELDPDAPKRIRCFKTFGTGHEIDPKAVHLGSYQLLDGSFVGHIYELFDTKSNEK